MRFPFCMLFITLKDLLLTGPVRVLESFGMLWKLILQFHRTWKVLEKERFFKMAIESSIYLFGGGGF